MKLLLFLVLTLILVSSGLNFNKENIFTLKQSFDCYKRGWYCNYTLEHSFNNDTKSKIFSVPLRFPYNGVSDILLNLKNKYYKLALYFNLPKKNNTTCLNECSEQIPYSCWGGYEVACMMGKNKLINKFTFEKDITIYDCKSNGLCKIDEVIISDIENAVVAKLEFPVEFEWEPFLRLKPYKVNCQCNAPSITISVIYL